MPGQAETDEDVRWGLGDVALGFLLAYVLTSLLQPLAYWLTNQPLDKKITDVPLSTVAPLQIAFAGGFLIAALSASIRKGRGPVTDFGLRMRWTDIPFGVVVGALTQFVATASYLPIIWWTSVTSDELSKPARDLTDKAHGAGVVLLIVAVVVIAPIVEEIFFRGLVLRSLERKYGRRWAIVGSSVIFGMAHLEGLQFPALFLFGLVAAVLATRTGRLGPGIWAHVAFNLVAVVSLLQ
jgi:membrane protease YdiL (CAAX protease family)